MNDHRSARQSTAADLGPVRPGWQASELVGRDRERQLLDAVATTATERAAVLLLHGEPGIGKTTLLDYAEGIFAGRVLCARGVESEAVLPYAALADLIRPIQDRLRLLPHAQREALRVCLALSDAPLANMYAPCVGMLNLLAAAGETEPVLLLVDDLHWLDPASLRVLLFVARRLSAERVGLVVTARDDHQILDAVTGLSVVCVHALSREESAELLHRRGLHLTDSRSAELFGICGGNPLALLQSAAALTRAQRRGDEPLPFAPSLGRRLESAWLDQLRDLPEATQQSLVAVAASRSTQTSALASVLVALGLSLEVLAPAEQAGLLALTPDTCDFTHPILRPLALSLVPLTTRLRVFQALAQTSTGPLRAWYLAAATTGADDTAAQALVEAAEGARRRSAFKESALAWRRAAELTTDPAARASSLYAAARNAFLVVPSSQAAAWCDQALAAPLTPQQRADLELLRGWAQTLTGHLDQAHSRMADAAEAIQHEDPARAAILLCESSNALGLGSDVTAAVRTAAESVRRAAGQAENTTWACAAGYAMWLSIAGEVTRAEEQLAVVTRHLPTADPVAHQMTMGSTAVAEVFTDHHDRAQHLLNTTIEAGRRAGAPTGLPLLLNTRTELGIWTGRWADAAADATEALAWAEELGQILWVGHGLTYLARLEAMRGNRARGEELITHSLDRAGGFGIDVHATYHPVILGLAALTCGDYSAAVDHLESALDRATRQGLGNPVAVPFAADLVEAHVRIGQRDRAEQVLAHLTRQATTTGLAWPTAAAARCRGLLAETTAEAEDAFAEAHAAHQRLSTPFEHARTQLCHGETLRRLRRPTEARAQLTSAHATFQRLGATTWASRTAAELAATGQHHTTAPNGRRAGPDLDALTPQELQVARAIADGLNNREVAALLYLSRKTVEAHLTRIYRKLGLRSRTQLTRALTTHDSVP